MTNENDRDASVTKKLTYLVIVGTIGAVIALLFAPKSGAELRSDIADASKKGLEKGKEAAAQIQEKAGEYYEVGKEKASELYQTGKEKAGEYTEKARSAAARTSNPFTAAIDAGKDAYSTEKRKTEVKSITEGRPTYPVKDESTN
jgi:gas vesicle protein